MAAAELQPMGVKTDPDFDRDVLEPLVRAYNRAVRAGETTAIQARLAARIREVLEPVVLAVYAAVQHAIAILQASRMPPLPDLPELETHEAAEFAYFMDGRDQGIPLSLRDGPKAALRPGAARPLEQIQLALGHQSIQTTQRYLGSELDLAGAACDRLGIRL